MTVTALAFLFALLLVWRSAGTIIEKVGIDKAVKIARAILNSPEHDERERAEHEQELAQRTEELTERAQNRAQRKAGTKKPKAG